MCPSFATKSSAGEILKLFKTCFWKCPFFENLILEKRAVQKRAFPEKSISRTIFQKFQKFYLRTALSPGRGTRSPNFLRYSLRMNVGEPEFHTRQWTKLSAPANIPIPNNRFPTAVARKCPLSAVRKLANSCLSSCFFFAAVSKIFGPESRPKKFSKPCESKTARITTVPQKSAKLWKKQVVHPNRNTL